MWSEPVSLRDMSTTQEREEGVSHDRRGQQGQSEYRIRLPYPRCISVL